MCAVEMTAGLRIDVDTLRGTRLGVAGLLHVLDRHRIKATFFFSVGPDNMGRHLRRLMHPAFFIKMLRSRAASLYGWDIIFRGTFRPGPLICSRCAGIIRRTAEAGHEIGLHAWDHHRWQVKIATMTAEAIRFELRKGKEKLEQLAGIPVSCSAAPGWRCTDTVLREKENFDSHYNSDCRGYSIFFPKINGIQFTQAQIPVTLPTYDELIGRNGVTIANYNEHLLSLFNPDRLNVLTIHAEAEGISCLAMFQDFLKKARSQNICFRPLKDLLDCGAPLRTSRMMLGEIEGREGWISCQEEALGNNHDK